MELVFVLWWLFGSACFLFAAWCIDPNIYVKDVLMAVFVGFLGPLCLLFCAFADRGILGKRIWPR